MLWNSVKPIFHCDTKTLAKTPKAKFHIGDTNMLVSKNAKICVTPTRTLKFALPPTQNPNPSQWNIGCVGSPGVGACIGHVHFMLFVSISFALGSSFQWNMGLTFCDFEASRSIADHHRSSQLCGQLPSHDEMFNVIL